MIATSEWEKRKAVRNECYRRGLDFRCGEDGSGDQPRTSRLNPQGDVRTSGIRQGQKFIEKLMANGGAVK